MQLAAITAALLISAASARKVPRRQPEFDGPDPMPESGPTRPVIPSECPRINRIDVKTWEIHSPRTPGASVVGLTEFYYKELLARQMDVPELPCTELDIRWIGRTKVGGGDACAYFVGLKDKEGFVCETYIAKTPAHRLREGAYGGIRETDVRLASSSLYRLTVRDGDGRSWSLGEPSKYDYWTTEGTAETILRKNGLQKCYASIEGMRRGALSAALKVYKVALVVLSGDTLQPGNLVVLHEKFSEKFGKVTMRFLEMSIRGDSHPLINTAEATAILERSVAVAFPDSLCVQLQRVSVDEKYRLSHYQ